MLRNLRGIDSHHKIRPNPLGRLLPVAFPCRISYSGFAIDSCSSQVAGKSQQWIYGRLRLA